VARAVSERRARYAGRGPDQRGAGMRAGVSVVIRAEQALLGAVMSDPAGQAYVLDLVEPDDMNRPYHGRVLAVMQRLRGSGTAPGPLAVYEEIKKDPDLPRNISHDGVLLAGLMEAAPRTNHAPAYAAIVISSGIRRRVALAASRMTQAADGHDLEAALAMAARARQELARCQARWEALPAPMRQELPAPAQDPRSHAGVIQSVAAVRDEVRELRRDLLAGARQGLEVRLASIARHVADVAAASADLRERHEQAWAAAEARPRGADAEQAGARALRDLAASPAQISAVRGWLQAAHFARPEQGRLYAVMRDMTDAGQPVDPVTVSWEASRRGIETGAAELAGGTGLLAVASARQVHRRGLLAQVARAGQDIQARADNHRLAAGPLLRSASDRLDHLDYGPRLDARSTAGWQHGTRRPGSGPAAEAEAGAA
jgi:replicative DNA helicase